MSDKKHIDRLFQEKFKDFEISPNSTVWKNIETELQSKKRKPFIVPWWYKIAGIAAVLTLIFLAGNFIFNSSFKTPITNSKAIEKAVDNSDIILQKEIDTKQGIVFENNSEEKIKEKDKDKHTLNNQKIVSGASVKQSSEGSKTIYETINTSKTNSVANNSNMKQVQKKEISPLNKLVKVEKEKTNLTHHLKSHKKNHFIDKNNLTETDHSLTKIPTKTKVENVSNPTQKAIEVVSTEISSVEASQKQQKSLLEVAAMQKEEKISNLEEKENIANTTKWEVSPFLAPVFYGGFGSQNAIDASLAQNESNSETTMTYGLNFSFKVSDRIKIRSGIGQISMAYNTNNIAFMTSVKPNSLANVTYSAGSSSLDIVSIKSVQNNIDDEFLGKSPYTKGTLHQEMGFIEIPLEVEYKLIDNKFGLSIIGGASTLFLNDNSLVINSENGRTNLGEMKNLNNVSFSTNIGLGLDYQISKKFEINLEPAFKYRINTYSNNNNGFKPYYFGIYTGLGFKF